MTDQIEKIVLEIGDKKAKLSLEEAKELRDILNKLYTKGQVKDIPLWLLYPKGSSKQPLAPPWSYQYWEYTYYPDGAGSTTLIFSTNRKA